MLYVAVTINRIVTASTSFLDIIIIMILIDRVNVVHTVWYYDFDIYIYIKYTSITKTRHPTIRYDYRGATRDQT